MKECGRCKQMFEIKQCDAVLYCSKTCKTAAFRNRKSAQKKEMNNTAVIEREKKTTTGGITPIPTPKGTAPLCRYCKNTIETKGRGRTGYCSNICAANFKIKETRSNEFKCIHCKKHLNQSLVGDTQYCSEECKVTAEREEEAILRPQRLLERAKKDKEDFEYREMFRVAKAAMELRLLDYDKQKANEIITLAGKCHTPWKRSFLSLAHAKMYYDKDDQELYRCPCGGMHYRTIKKRRSSW